ncbi:MAG: hypothetical protein NVS3B24_01120 [Candidatus Dormibacteria bacterium]
MAGFDVYLETAERRAFACSYAWPGWVRPGKTEAAALTSLVEYCPRYAAVPALAGIEFDLAPSTIPTVVERLPGDATTAFGAPSRIPTADLQGPGGNERERLLALLAGCWKLFDEVVAGSPEALRKGPRGGGRDRSKIVEHVLGAESSYSRMVGARLTPPDPSDPGSLGSHRESLLAGLRTADHALSDGRGRWPMRYATRRIAWHVLDHAWEIEDRR